MIIVMLGPQGCGKGTQAKILSEKLDIPHISSGDLLREIAQRDTPTGIKLKTIMDAGDLVDDDFLEEILEERFAKDDCKNGFILDGTPRDIYQVTLLEKFFSPDVAIYIDISDEESMMRLLKRAGIEGRSDDTREGIAHRLHMYHEKTSPVVDYFEKHNKLIRVNGMQSAQQVFDELWTALQKRKANTHTVA